MFTDDDDDEEPINTTGTVHKHTIQAEINQTVRRSEVECDPECTEDEEDDELIDLKARCEEIEIVLETKGPRAVLAELHSELNALIHDLYSVSFNVKDFPVLTQYL